MPVEYIDDWVKWTNERGDVMFYGHKSGWEQLHAAAHIGAREITEKIDAEVMRSFNAPRRQS